MADKEVKPKVLLVSCCSNSKREELLQGLTKSQHEDQFVGNDASSSDGACSEHDWLIENKYYSAALRLILVHDTNPSDSTRALVNEVEAVVISFDLGNDGSLTKAKQWGELFKEQDIEIKVLLAEESGQIDDKKQFRERVNDWCVENDFELVECCQNEEDQKNDDFPEKIGFERIKEALDAHMWPNMIRKKNVSAAKTGPTHKGEDSKGAAGGDKAEDEAIFNGNEAQLENFEELLGSIQEMKMHAQSLSDNERKEYAEKVTLAFWRSMGLDEDEISGL